MTRLWTKELAQKIKEGNVRKGIWCFTFFTVGQILEELASEGLFISRETFLHLEKSGLFKLRRTVGGWRTMTRVEADAVKTIIWCNYVGLSHREWLKQQEKETKKLNKEGND